MTENIPEVLNMYTLRVLQVPDHLQNRCLLDQLSGVCQLSSVLTLPQDFFSGSGFRKKFMFKFVVTAKTTDPTVFKIAAYMAKSASSIIDGPETVPPGRK